MKEYRFLLLDADYTLLDFDADMEAAFRSMFARCFPGTAFDGFYHRSYERCNNRWWDRLERGECTKPELFHGRFADFLKETSLPGDPTVINAAYFEELARGGTLLSGALELVQQLNLHHELYIVTNGNAPSQKARLERSGLLRYVKDYFVSEDAGAAKPELRYFEYVFSRIPGFQKEQAIVIGDSLSSDIQGACNAGLDSLWYNPGRLKNEGKLPITFEAANFEEVLRFFSHA